MNLKGSWSLAVSISDITYVDFKKKEIVAKQILQFDKTELLREGLINFDRLVKRGQVSLVYDKAG